MVRLEKTRNEQLIEDYMDTPVTFGAEIQLMHSDSKSFLCGSQTCAQYIKIGYECKLSQWYSKFMVFKILPKLKSRNQGEMIQYKDLLIFENVENCSYLGFCFGDSVKYLQSNPTFYCNNPFRPSYNVSETTNYIFNCYLSMVPQTAFTCLFHSSCKREAKNLYGQDFVRILHTEMNAHLSADICYSVNSSEQGNYRDKQDSMANSKPQVYLNHHGPDQTFERQSGSSIWEIELLKISESGKHVMLKERSNLNEEVEDSDNNKNEILENRKYSIPIMIKHVSSQLRMHSVPKLKDTLTELQAEKCIPVLEEAESVDESDVFEDQRLHFYLFPLIKLNDVALVDQTYFISDNSFKFMKIRRNRHCKRGDLVKEFSTNRIYSSLRDDFTPLDDKDFPNTTRFQCFFSPSVSSKDTFLISRLRPQEVEDVMYLRSAVYHLNFIANFFIKPMDSKSKMLQKVPSVREYNRLLKVLNKVAYFVVDQERSMLADTHDIENIKPNQWKQQLMKDLGVIDLIMDILYYSLKDNVFYEIESITPSSPYTPVLKACYLTLRKGIEEYRPNELWSSQWLQVIISQSLSFTKECEIEADKTMKELIDNNRAILTTRITDKIVTKCIEALKRSKERDDKYITILRALCICNGKAIIQNQKLLTMEIIVEDSEDPRSALLIPFKMNEENIIEIYVYGEDVWEDLRSFVATVSDRRANFYKYLIAMIMLLSDICFERNYGGIEALKKVYPINLCLTILTDEECPFQMREAFGKLMSNLWINISPFYKITLPNPIKTYEGLTDRLTFTHFHGKQIIYDKVKDYIPKYLRSFTYKYLIADPMEVRLLNNLLEIMLLMIELGMYSEVFEFNVIIDAVKALLRKRFKLEYQEQQNQGLGLLKICRF